MAHAFDPVAAARFIADAHHTCQVYRNLPDALAPQSVAEAYAVQEALRAIWEPQFGPVAGLKIATTTKVMQQLMGIDHPCGGVLYARRIHTSPHRLKLSDYMHVVVECELAVRVAETLAKRATPFSGEDARRAVDAVMPAFELIEDRNAVYKETRAFSLIADNAWNAGIVLGQAVQAPAGMDLNALKGRLATAVGTKEGATDDPMGALAWVANLAADRGLPLQAGQVVITGSIIATLPIAAGETFSFDIDGIGGIQMTASA